MGSNYIQYEVKMKLAIVGSRNVEILDIEKYMPEGISEIVSGGAKGADALAKEFAEKNGIKYTEFQPKYNLYGKAAPLKRNDEIADYADRAIAFWDGKSKGTKNVVGLFRKRGKEIDVIIVR